MKKLSLVLFATFLLLPGDLLARGPRTFRPVVNAFGKQPARPVVSLPNAWAFPKTHFSRIPSARFVQPAQVPLVNGIGKQNQIVSFTPSKPFASKLENSLERKFAQYRLANQFGQIRPVPALSILGNLPSQQEEYRRLVDALGSGKEEKPLPFLAKMWLDKGGFVLYQNEEQLAADCHAFYKGEGTAYIYSLTQHKVLVYELPMPIFYRTPYSGFVTLVPGEKYVIMYDTVEEKGRIVEKWLFDNPTFFSLVSR